MDTIQTAILAIFGLIIIAAVFRIFSAPLKFLMKLALNTVFGFVALIAFNLVGGFVGISLGVNLLNAFVIGVFGLPGLALLLVLKWLFLI